MEEAEEFGITKAQREDSARGTFQGGQIVTHRGMGEGAPCGVYQVEQG